MNVEHLRHVKVENQDCVVLFARYQQEMFAAKATLNYQEHRKHRRDAALFLTKWFDACECELHRQIACDSRAA
jgi:hypothetical protein